MKEYMICYTINGQGYTKNEPWIDTRTEDPEEARQSYNDFLEYLIEYHPLHEVWIESRNIGPWERLDPTTLG